MTNPTNIELREIMFDAELDHLKQVHPPAVDHGLIPEVRQLVGAIKERSCRRFDLIWTGSKVPRGVELPTGTIAWTQHGIVRSDDGEQIGTYDRIEEWGGPDGDQHRMIVYVSRP